MNDDQLRIIFRIIFQASSNNFSNNSSNNNSNNDDDSGSMYGMDENDDVVILMQKYSASSDTLLKHISILGIYLSLVAISITNILSIYRKCSIVSSYCEKYSQCYYYY
jgi:hypothetical protein